MESYLLYPGFILSLVANEFTIKGKIHKISLDFSQGDDKVMHRCEPSMMGRRRRFNGKVNPFFPTTSSEDMPGGYQRIR